MTVLRAIRRRFFRSPLVVLTVLMLGSLLPLPLLSCLCPMSMAAAGMAVHAPQVEASTCCHAAPQTATPSCCAATPQAPTPAKSSSCDHCSVCSGKDRGPQAPLPDGPQTLPSAVVYPETVAVVPAPVWMQVSEPTTAQMVAPLASAPAAAVGLERPVHLSLCILRN
jgi:hypothetical protein